MLFFRHRSVMTLSSIKVSILANLDYFVAAHNARNRKACAVSPVGEWISSRSAKVGYELSDNSAAS
jgi:hypothetical protein